MTLTRFILPILTLAGVVVAQSPSRTIERDPAAPEPFVEALPEGYDNVSVEQRLGAQLPLEAVFTDHTGRRVRLGDYFDGTKPVVIHLGYFGCPMLCGIMTDGLIESFRDQRLKIGTDYTVLSISFDPLETSRLAADKRQSYLRQYNRPDENHGWHFLTGSTRDIRALTDAAGYQFRWVPSAQQWSHPAAIIIATPDGRISRYLFGVRFPPTTLRLSLVEASERRIGNLIDDFLLTCFTFDGSKYTLAARRLMQGGGILTVIVVLVTLRILFVRERRLRTAPDGGPQAPVS